MFEHRRHGTGQLTVDPSSPGSALTSLHHPSSAFDSIVDPTTLIAHKQLTLRHRQGISQRWHSITQARSPQATTPLRLGAVPILPKKILGLLLVPPPPPPPPLPLPALFQLQLLPPASQLPRLVVSHLSRLNINSHSSSNVSNQAPTLAVQA